MEIWVTHANLWIRRVAIIHQLKYKKTTDTERLFRYCTVYSPLC
jgi:3-methyladenine DNA glycosylase AlkD